MANPNQPQPLSYPEDAHNGATPVARGLIGEQGGPAASEYAYVDPRLKLADALGGLAARMMLIHRSDIESGVVRPNTPDEGPSSLVVLHDSAKAESWRLRSEAAESAQRLGWFDKDRQGMPLDPSDMLAIRKLAETGAPLVARIGSDSALAQRVIRATELLAQHESKKLQGEIGATHEEVATEGLEAVLDRISSTPPHEMPPEDGHIE